MLKQTFWLENLIKYSPVIIILLLSFKERENMALSCKFKSPVLEHFDLLVILLFFYVCRWKNIQIYIMSTCFGCEIQTVRIQLLELNRNNRKPTSRIKTEPNRKKSEACSPMTHPQFIVPTEALNPLINWLACRWLCTEG